MSPETPSSAATARPASPWRRALVLADATPASRNRYVDLLRALSIGAVVLGHWLVAAPFVGPDGLEVGHLLALQPWTVWLTWGFQIMPVFFLVGGYSNGASWSAAEARGEGYGAWLRARIERLAGPVLPALLVWAGLAGLGTAVLGVAPDQMAELAWFALVPVWFLAVYLGIVATTPLAVRAWRRFGLGSVAALVSAAVAVDALVFAAGLEGLGWANYAFVWLTMQQLGLAWRAGRIDSRSAQLKLAGGALVALFALVGFGPYPVAMIGVPGAEVSNSQPPTLALLALGLFQTGAVLALEQRVRRWLEARRLWAATVMVNGMIMSLYLWHMSAMICVVAIAHALGDVGLASAPGSAAWWQARPLWLAAYAMPTVALVLAFVRFEARAARAGSQPISARRALLSGALVASGLAFTASGGVGSATGQTGVRLWVVAQPLVGAALARFGPLARMLSMRRR